MDKIEHLKNSIEKQQSVFATCKNSDSVTKLSFKLCERMAEKGKPFIDGEFIKNCLTNIHRTCVPREKIFGGANQPFPLYCFRQDK